MATEVERLVASVEARTSQFEKSFDRIQKQTARATDDIRRRVAAMEKANTSSFARIGQSFRSFGSLGTVVAGGLASIAAALGTRELIRYSDTWTRANNALRVAGLSGDDLKGVMDELFAAAQRQGVPIEALTQLYGRAARAAKDLGATKDELIAFSEDVARALKVAGTSPEAASGALLQLGQALGASRIQAEEFNSLMEGASPILQTVANGVEEAGGSISRLRALVVDGQLSNVAFFKGFQAGAAGLREQAAQAEDTIAQSMERVANAVTKAVGELAKTSGASKNATENLGYVARAIEQIPNLATASAAKLAELEKWLNSVGNSPFWRKVGEFLGTDYSGAGMLRTGFGTPSSQAELNSFYDALGVQGSARYGSGGIGSDPDRNSFARPIRAADYPVQSGPAKGKGAQDEIDQYAKLTQASKDRIAQLQIEQQTLGMTEEQAAAYRFEQEALLQAQRQGIELSPQQRAELQALAEEYGKITGSIEQAKNAQQELNEIGNIAKGFYSDFANGLRQGENAAKSFGDAVQNLLNRIIDMMAEKAIMDFLKMLSAPSPGGTVGATVGASFGVPGAATGGSIRGPGSGTSDSIPAMLSNGEFVVNAAMAKKYGPLLHAINSGNFRLPAFATGGAVGAPAPRGGAMGGLNVQVVNNTGTAATGRVETQRGSNGQITVKVLLDAMRQELVSDLERMGPIARAHQSRFGLNSARGMTR